MGSCCSKQRSTSVAPIPEIHEPEQNQEQEPEVNGIPAKFKNLKLHTSFGLSASGSSGLLCSESGSEISPITRFIPTGSPETPSTPLND